MFESIQTSPLYTVIYRSKSIRYKMACVTYKWDTQKWTTREFKFVSGLLPVYFRSSMYYYEMVFSRTSRGISHMQWNSHKSNETDENGNLGTYMVFWTFIDHHYHIVCQVIGHFQTSNSCVGYPRAIFKT